MLDDWGTLKLDSGGNAKATALVKEARKRALLQVTVSGDLNHDTIKVASLSAGR